MKKLTCLLAALGILAVPAAHGASLMETHLSGTLNQAIPDGNPSGLANVITIAGSMITEIEDISVSLEVTAAWNGDIYATLQHSSGFAVLLNRVGRTGGDTFGYDDSGFDITLNDLGGFGNVHTYQDLVAAPSPLTGFWGSDGRAVDPDSVVSGDTPSAQLDNFAGLDTNGDWTLFVADLSGGDSATLVKWSLDVEGVPEPGTSVLALLGMMMLLRRKR